MKKFKLITKILLSFALVYSGISFINVVADEPLDNLVLNKEAVYNPTTDEVEYLLEAYTKGEVKTETVAVPTDIILVLDQSQSMTSSFGSQSRVNALRNAVQLFITSTTNHANANDVDHRISMLGFASGSSGSFAGTEILSVPSGNTVRYNTSGTYKNSLVSSLLNVRTQSTALNTARSRISATGYTHTNLGLIMANELLNRLDLTDGRQRVVIVFTDGEPNGTGTTNSTSNQAFIDAANAALVQSNTIKTKGVPVYTVAIYPGANPATDNTSGTFVNSSPARVNRFLHYLSSNYTGITTIATSMALNNAGKYLVADTPEQLNNIFTTISQEISQPAIDLDATTVMLDIVSEEFEIPTGAIIETYTSDYLGGGSWAAPVALSATVNVVGNSVSVSGFNYNSNFVLEAEGSTPAQGKKLIVKFKAKPIPGFLGGNVIDTNTNASGIYKGSSMIKPFTIPKVDVDKNAEFIVNDVNMYLTNELVIADLITDTNGLVSYIQNGVTYTLDGLRNKHMDTTFTIKNELGDIVYTGFVAAGTTNVVLTPVVPMNLALEADHIFDSTLTLAPINAGSVTTKNDSLASLVKVYTPVVKVEDTTLYRGEQFTLDSAEKVGWAHNGIIEPVITLAHYVEPTITFGMEFVSGSDSAGATTYYPEFTSIYKLKVLLNGTDKTTRTQINSQSVERGFAINVLVKKIKITKIVDRLLDENQSFIFNITWDKPAHLAHFNDYDSEVVIVGANSVFVGDLPIGDYSVSEDVTWSYRYELVGSNLVELTLEANDTVLEAVFTNRLKDDKWLTDEAIETNIFR